MKRIGIAVLLFLAFAGGIAIQKFVLDSNSSLNANATKSAATEENKPLYWVAPMDKNYRRDKPGKSPMGMDLVPVYEDGAKGGEDEGTVMISPVVENNLGVRTEIVQRGLLQLPIQTIGYVAFDEDKLSHIHSRVDGWIEVLNVTSEGDPVAKGQTLYELYSPALVNAQEEFLAALRSGNTSLEKASRSRLLSLGLTNSQIDNLQRLRKVEQRISVSAERAGFVKELKVREGMFIKPATEVMSIGTLDTVWVIAEVFERQASWVKSGQTVEMRAEAIPGKIWSGTVDYLYPVLDSKTRTLKVRIRFDNPDQTLKPNMFANLRFLAPIAEETLSIPKAALIRGGRYDRVVLAKGDGKFKSVLVDIGIEAGERIQILKGLNDGDIVVTSAQFLIDSESNIDAEIARMEVREKAESQKVSGSVKSVTATGKITKVMGDMSMLSISHDPIVAWSWPAMKMDFQVAKGISLAGLSNENISFELQKEGDGGYLITAIEVTQPILGVNIPSNGKTKTVLATGTVKQVMKDMDMVTIVHDPIKEWAWPKMTMTFSLAASNHLPKIMKGDRIQFQLQEKDDGEYQITMIERLDSTAAKSK
jgi:Cu(I)/Ag(I) efflux system membrane fusion protein